PFLRVNELILTPSRSFLMASDGPLPRRVSSPWRELFESTKRKLQPPTVGGSEGESRLSSTTQFQGALVTLSVFSESILLLACSRKPTCGWNVHIAHTVADDVFLVTRTSTTGRTFGGAMRWNGSKTSANSRQNPRPAILHSRKSHRAK